MRADYRSAVIRRFCEEQIRRAAPDERLKQLDRTERLMDELSSSEIYQFSEIYSRITGSRCPPAARCELPGEDLLHDLRLFVARIAEITEIPLETAGERVLTMRELAKALNVSTKTISRWRRFGLISRRFILDGRKRVGFPESCVRRFVARNRDLVRRGAGFSQLTPEERQRIIDEAGAMARDGVWPAEATKRLALATGRSIETVRYTLKQHDRQFPDQAVFSDHRGPLRFEMKRRIYQRYRRGESVDSLAKRFCRSKKSIYRVLAEMRAKWILDLPLEYIANDEFAHVRAQGREKEVLADMPENPTPLRKSRPPSDLPGYLASLYDVPLLTREQELHLFRKMNYLKYRADRLRQQLDLGRPKNSLMSRIERFYDEAVAIKNQIIRANLRLVVSIAKRHVLPTMNFFELVSDGNMSLIRAVDRFDYSRGNKFSTYASWAIMKNFARTLPNEHRHQDRYRTSQPEFFTSSEDLRSDEREQETAQTQREAQVRRILARLDRREQEIIIRRFGLVRGEEPLTLKQVGAQLGVSKERIRQIECRALNHLRKVAEEENIALTG
jgi:RNA polymerase primary sigma factor/RNA polymerase sigma factor